MTGQTSGTCATGPKALNLLRLQEDLRAAHPRLHRVVIENLPWQACIDRYDMPGTLFFLAPPYWQTKGYGTEFGLDQYEERRRPWPA